jgi:nicotinamide-nucleotide amidase
VAGVAGPQGVTAVSVVAELARRGLTIAVAESLTGGLLVAELVSVPGASAVVNGGVVAYNTELKHTILGVSADLLASNGAVDPDVAAQMAQGVRVACAVGGTPASIGISTTGVAGPDPQDGKPVGTVFVGIAGEFGTSILPLHLEGDREAIRRAVVSESLTKLEAILATLPT